MKLKISSCESTALKKDILRFAPAWGLFSAGAAIVFYVALALVDGTRDSAEFLIYLPKVMAVIAMCYGFLNAQLLFGYLFDSRMCNSMHSFPLRRENWFLVHTGAGLLFFLVPTGVFYLLMLPLCGGYYYIALLSMAECVLYYLFFFGLAVFSVMLTGNRFAALVVYGILNFLSMMVWWVVDTLYAPLLYGVVLQEDIFILFCPIVQIMQDTSMDANQLSARFVLNGGVWLYAGILAVLGVAFAALSLLLYRRRKLECAGDFVAESWLQPVFLAIYSLFAGMLLAAFLSLFTGSESSVGWMLVGLFIGVLTGRMLLMRTVKIFNKSTFLSYGVLGLALLCSVVLFQLDPFGIAKWVPDPQQVGSVTISLSGDSGTYTRQENIQDVVDLHSYILTGFEEDEREGRSVSFTYTMKNGSTVRREYYIPTARLENANDPVWPLLKEATFTPEFILDCPDIEKLSSYISDIYVRDNKDTFTDIQVYDRQARELLQAILLDIQQGTLPPYYSWWYGSYGQQNMETRFNLSVYVKNAQNYHWEIPETAVNTYNYLLQRHLDKLAQK